MKSSSVSLNILSLISEWHGEEDLRTKMAKCDKKVRGFKKFHFVSDVLFEYPLLSLPIAIDVKRKDWNVR